MAGDGTGLDRDESKNEKKLGNEKKVGDKVKRVSHPKVRSGCLTCKQRRVKCDERMPFCFRCEKFGVQCDGYLRTGLSQAETAQSRTTNRPLIPRKRDASPFPEQVRKARFRNYDEMRYFRLFCEKTSLQLSGYYDPILWGRIVLQASEAEDSIRHAVISIGALDMTAAMMQDSKNENAKEHHLFALKQYGEAIRDMRAMAQRQKEMHNLQHALVASILIICFETYHGNYASAAQQIRTGVRLIEDQKRTKDSPGIEEDLARAFDRLDVQSMSHSDPFTLEEHAALRNVYTHEAKDLPPFFTDIKAARDFFNFISRRACHFASMAWKMEHMEARKKPSDTYNFFDPNVHASWRAALKEEAKKFVALSEAWMDSFLPIFKCSQEIVKKSAGRVSKSTIAPIAMRNHFLSLRIAFRNFQDVSEMAWDKSMPEFEEILENTELLMANADNLVFSFDLQTVWPLDILAKKCRDGKMRRKAIQLLKKRPRREGIWDSVVAAMVCDWVVAVEEEGMLEDGTIPENARVRNIGVELDSENRQAKVWCYLSPKHGYIWDAQSMPRREAYLEWGSHKWNRGFGEGWSWSSDFQNGVGGGDDRSNDMKGTSAMGIYMNAQKNDPVVDETLGTSSFARPVSLGMSYVHRPEGERQWNLE